MIKELVAVATLATVLASGGCSNESKCRSRGGSIQSQNVYDNKGNFDHEHFQCIVDRKVVDEWDSKH